VQLPAGVDCQLLQLPEELTQGPIPGAAWWQLPVTVPMVGNGPATGLQPQSMPSAIAAQQPSFPSVPPPPPSTRVNGRVWALAQDPCGSRRVQQALEEAADDQERAGLAMELRGHVLEALQCPHANHVLQKCIVSMRTQALQFVLDELMHPCPEQVVQVARHKYGCRILQRLLEHCRMDQLHRLVAELMASAVSLSKHAYANFVIQHLFEYGTQEQRCRLTGIFEHHAKALGKDDHGRAVLSKALSHVGSEERTSLARALLQEQGLLVRMARTRHGHAAVKSVLMALDGPEREAARGQLLEGVATLRMSRYGRTVVACLSQPLIGSAQHWGA